MEYLRATTINYTMVQEVDLKQQAEQLGLSVDSVGELLQIGSDLCLGNVEPERLKAAHRGALLDSLRVKRFHKHYKTWENQRRDEFIEKEIRAYNKKYAQMTRLHAELAELNEKYQDLKNSVLLPDFHFLSQTLKQFGNEKLLDGLEDLSLVTLDSLFSLDPTKDSPPEYETFNKLMNLEFRLRTLCQIKYEVLLRVRLHLTSKNSQWARRDALLNDFLRSVKEKVDEVKRIRTAESHDLADVDVDLDIEFSDDDEDEKDDEEKDEEAKDGEDEETKEGGDAEDENQHQEHDSQSKGQDADGVNGNADQMDSETEIPETEEADVEENHEEEPSGETPKEDDNAEEEANIAEEPSVDTETTDMLID